MSIFSNFLNLFKYNPPEDAQNTFNIQTALNDNWDKVDAFATNVSREMEEKADIKKTITRQNYVNLTDKALLDYLKTQILTNGNVFGSVFAFGGTDMMGLIGFITWKSDTANTGSIFVFLENIHDGKLYYRRFYSETTWMDTNWQTIATTETGTWTPEIVTSNATITYLIQEGTFVKIGKLVRCTFNIRCTLNYTQSGGVYIVGIPISAKKIDTGTGIISYSATHQNLTKLANIAHKDSFAIINSNNFMVQTSDLGITGGSLCFIGYIEYEVV